MQVEVNIHPLKAHAKRLQQVSKSAMPRAIRNTLNSVAFHVKQSSMLKTSKEEFVNREKNFFKANSSVSMANGFNVNNMSATIGFKPTKVKHNQSVEDLEQQEHGGDIKGRSFIPNKEARVGGSDKRVVRPINRLENISNAISAEKVMFKGSRRHRGQRWIRAAFKAVKLYGRQALVIGNVLPNGTRTLSRIDSITKGNARGGKLNIRRTPLYSYKKGRAVKVAGTNFMKRASLESAMKGSEFFLRHAMVEYDRLK